MATANFLVWGNNQSSLLSKSSSKCLASPIPFNLPYRVVSLCASEKHISFLTSDGSVFSYGTNLDGRLGVSTKAVDKVGYDAPVKVPIRNKVIRIESGFSHMCALTQAGELFAWGLGDYGALGTGEFKSRSIPTKIQLPQKALQNLRQISCGAMHTAFLTDEGQVYTCGSNQYGQLGINKPQKISTPTPISFHQQIKQISCGVFYTLLLTKQGRVYGMGNNKYGQLGIGHKVNQCHPTMIRDLEGIVKVSAGYHSGAIDSDGNLYIWGSGSFGELIRPQKFVLSVPINDIAIRGFFGLAIGHTSRNQNRVYTWGNNTFGQLGIGDFSSVKEPTEVDGLRGKEIGKIVLGVNFALVLMIEDYGNWASQEIFKPVEDYRREIHPRQTEKKSVVGFQENYLNSYLKYQQQAFINAHQQPQQPLLREYSPHQYQKKQRNISPLIHKEPLYQSKSPYNSKSPSYRLQLQQPQHVVSSSRDYQKLFINLSQDYDLLTYKYTNLEKQFNLISQNAPAKHQTIRQIEKQTCLQEEISKLNYQMKQLKNQVRGKNKVIEDQRVQIEKINLLTSQREGSINLQIQGQFNKILNKKQVLIGKMSQTLKQIQQQNKMLLHQSEREKAENTKKLELQKQKTTAIVKEHQNLIDQLQQQLKKNDQKNIVLREENQMLKQKFKNMEDSFRQIETLRIKMEEESLTERQLFEKSKNQIKQIQIKNQILTSKLQELEIELNYEKQFNKKYELSLNQVTDTKDKINRQLTLQKDINKQNSQKIEIFKADIQKYKKYKKQLDEKNIIIEENNQNFENYKRKINDIIGQKQDTINSLQDDLKDRTKDFQNKLKQKDQTLDNLSRQVNRLEKQLGKSKENVNALKQQLRLKDDEMQNMQQQQSSMEKKITYLSTQLHKQQAEREEIIKNLGQVKRQYAKLKMNFDQLQNQLLIEKQEKNKIKNLVDVKNQQIEGLKVELEKLNGKYENIKQESQMYKDQLQDTTFKLQEQVKMNKELNRANQQFAQSEQELNQNIQNLQNKIFELEDQNKSYQPRYEALLQRNKQLDQRNLEMGEMINKAIQIQAQNYKTNILKQVESNTDNFLKHVKEEQQFKAKQRRKMHEPEDSKNQGREEQQMFVSPPQSLLKEEPYTKEMKKRINSHKKKVSDSANKLANLLDIDEGIKTERRNLGIQSRRTEDLQKINSQMESFNNHKEEFMSKIHSFAEKLKIL